MNSIKNLTLLLLLTVMAVFVSNCEQPEENEATVDIEAQIDSLISQMTLEEKVNMIHASSAFTSGGVERLGIPELVMSDGPHGVRHEHGRDWEKDKNVADSSTYLPVGTALAATWNPELGYKFGKVLGSEANFRGKDIILGPGLNIIRSPLNGRNFEYLTEDPYLNAQMVVGYVKGVQDQGIAACAKHYIANTLEYQRDMVNVEMSDRALREIYLPGYKAAVQEGGVLSIMSAYNKLRGDYCSHSAFLLDEILKGEYGFEGLVMSDWNAVKTTMGAVNVGLDIEMGTDLEMMRRKVEVDFSKFHLGDTVVTLVQNGTVDESVIDKKVRRILRVMFKIHKFGERPAGAHNTEEHQAIARNIAEEAIVLMKNEALLPLQAEGLNKIAVVGANATWKHAGAGGSSQVKAFYEVTPMAGLQNLLGEDVSIDFAQGYVIEKDAGADDHLIQEAVKAVSEAETAIFIGGWIHGYSDEWDDNAFDAESVDKPSMKLPFGQDQLIQEILSANPNTIIVLIGGGPIDMTAWEADAKAIVQAWYPGMEGGNALADILFGKVNPSGKLPMTFPKKLEDSPTQALARYPDENLLIDHTEGIYVGYRYYDTYEVEPAFAFGHGLSYTDFEYKDFNIDRKGESVTVKLQVTNTGEVNGAEVVQVYVHDEASALERPEKELKAFEKVFIEAGGTKAVSITLEKDAFSYYDDTQNKWVL
ncbi:MAG: glycosyl hydrolase, partial [Bacteroidetes bacterium]